MSQALSTAVVSATQRATVRRSPRWFARRSGVWFFRILLAVPFIFMAPEVVSALQGRPGAVANISATTADVLGTSSFLIFVMMLSVTPLHTAAGWRWHLVLRRDYGIAMFVTAGTDLALAAITTGDTFPGTVFTRIAGHTFLVFGTLSVALLIPLVVTANRRSQRWLGGHWKAVQRLTYVLWATILVHLFFLFGLTSFFLAAVAVSVPLAVMRIPAVRRWWRGALNAGRHRLLRGTLAAVLAIAFLAGYVPLVHELVIKGTSAFAQQRLGD